MAERLPQGDQKQIKAESATQNLNSFARRMSLFETLITEYITLSDHNKLVKDVN